MAANVLAGDKRTTCRTDRTSLVHDSSMEPKTWKADARAGKFGIV